MTFQAVAFIDGLSYPAEAVRRLVYAATGGTTGVLGADSFRVTAGSTPGAFVNVSAGVGAVVGGGSVQSYLVTNDQLVQLAVPANNSSTPITRYVVFSIRDPQYAGMPALSGPSDIAGDLQVVSVLPSNRPYLRLATLTIPGNTGTITNSMVTNDLSLSAPRTRPDSFVHLPTATYTLGTTYQQWGGFAIPFHCPMWANRADVLITVEGMEQKVAGYIRAHIKPTINGVSADMSQEVTITRNGPIQRHSFSAMGSFSIPSNWRDTTVQVGMRAYIGAGPSGAFEIDSESAVMAQILFSERR